MAFRGLIFILLTYVVLGSAYLSGRILYMFLTTVLSR